jgi:hypothetical protein
MIEGARWGGYLLVDGFGGSGLVMRADVRWKESNETTLTTSNPRPFSILSVVATTFPPFRCRSHMMLRRATCGNICWMRSTSASRAARADDEPRGSDDAPDEKKKYRTARPPRRSTRRSCGRLMVWSVVDIFFPWGLPLPGGGVEVASAARRTCASLGVGRVVPGERWDCEGRRGRRVVGEMREAWELT